MANPATLKNFAKGHDPRRNLKGRPKHPKDFKQLREAVQAFLAEPSTKNKTRLDQVLMAMAKSKGERKALLEFGYGKVPQSIDVTSKGESIKLIAIDTEKV